MEYKSVVFNAARDGNVRRLKVFLEGRPATEVRTLLSSCTYGTPPLVIAARNGHLEVVRYLIEKGVDIEQIGSVVFDGESIEGAPALWCAAAAGYFEIVTLLVENNANVNHTTATSSTPLRAACFDGHLNIVTYLVEHGADIEIANMHGHTSLMIACYRGRADVVKYLLSVNAKVNTKSLKGNTALHDSAEAGSAEIVQLLLDHGAVMDVDINGLTPMLSAASFGHKPVVEYLCQHEKCPLTDRVDGLLLLGATYVDKKRDIIGAFRCWRQALNLRKQYDLPIEQFPLTQAAYVAFQGHREVANDEQLEALVNDADKIRMQSIIVRERILGPAHPDTTYYIRYRGAVYADVGVFERCIDLWLYALKIQQSTMEPLCSLTLGSFMSFAELFSYLLNDQSRTGTAGSLLGQQAAAQQPGAQPPTTNNNNNNNWTFGDAAALVNHNRHQQQQQAQNRNSRPVAAAAAEQRRLRFDDVYAILRLAVEEVNRWLSGTLAAVDDGTTSCRAAVKNCRHVDTDKDGDHKLLLVVLHLLALAKRCLVYEETVAINLRLSKPSSPKKTHCDEDRYKLCKLVYDLLRIDPRDRKQSSLLHLTCDEKSTALGSYPLCRFPSLPVIELLLEAGADPSLLDVEGRTPLHLCLTNQVVRPCVAKCLLSNGASFFTRDKTGRSPFELVKMASSDVPVVNYLTLKHLTAVAVRQHQISYRNRVPTHLYDILERV